jgi:hypothetical protein
LATDDAPMSTGPRGSTPVPDPTQLTDAAIAKLKEQLESYIDGQVQNINTRITGAVNLTDERFQAAEKLRLEQKKDTKDAVDAALSAAKEAVKEQTTASERSIDKSETGTRDQLRGLDVKIDDLKERVGRIESVKLGAAENHQVTQDSSAARYALLAAVISVVLAAIAVMGFLIAEVGRGATP